MFDRASTNLDCNTEANGNAGCGVNYPTPSSYGPPFNGVGGGWYVKHTPSHIHPWQLRWTLGLLLSAHRPTLKCGSGNGIAGVFLLT